MLNQKHFHELLPCVNGLFGSTSYQLMIQPSKVRENNLHFTMSLEILRDLHFFSKLSKQFIASTSLSPLNLSYDKKLTLFGRMLTVACDKLKS